MKPKIYPNKLSSGDEVRVVAPSRSLGIISPEVRQIANERLEKMGLKLSFGKNVEEMDEFGSSSIQSRVTDIHEAFKDKDIKAVLAVIGGFNCNQLLRYLDWDLIKNNPKIFCGYSDTTALQNAIYAKTGLVTYSSPSYSSFGKLHDFDYTLGYFQKCVFSQEPFEIKASEKWSNDSWFINQESRKLIDNLGFLTINPGEARLDRPVSIGASRGGRQSRLAQGTIIGSNLCTFNLLKGTEYFPSFDDSILFIEDDEESNPYRFDRDLQSLIHLPGFEGVKGLVIGRFENASKMTNELLIKIIKTKKELDNIPVIANVDFGHTDPQITFPVGGEANILAESGKITLNILKHWSSSSIPNQ